jgi:kinetochore protein NDC80
MKSSGRRRSSIGGGRQSIIPTGPAVKPDPRPISDKAYQQDCIKQLLKFLQDSGYEYPVSQKSLSRPSGKDFTNIVTFMLRRIDPTFQDGTLKIEDEIAMNFKAMGYPFAVSKTALVAAGSPHTWPTLLAALTWLMMRIRSMEELVRDDENDDEYADSYESLEELENKTDRIFFNYLSNSYEAFLKGDEQLGKELTVRFGQQLARGDEYISEEIDLVTDHNGAMVEKMAHLDIGEKE